MNARVVTLTGTAAGIAIAIACSAGSAAVKASDTTILSAANASVERMNNLGAVRSPITLTSEAKTTIPLDPVAPIKISVPITKISLKIPTIVIPSSDSAEPPKADAPSNTGKELSKPPSAEYKLPPKLTKTVEDQTKIPPVNYTPSKPVPPIKDETKIPPVQYNPPAKPALPSKSQAPSATASQPSGGNPAKPATKAAASAATKPAVAANVNPAAVATSSVDSVKTATMVAAMQSVIGQQMAAEAQAGAGTMLAFAGSNGHALGAGLDRVAPATAMLPSGADESNPVLRFALIGCALVAAANVLLLVARRRRA